MSKKHYVEFARMIGESFARNESSVDLVERFIHYFRVDNPRFNEDTFRSFIVNVVDSIQNR